MILVLFLQIFLGIGLLRTLKYQTTLFKFLALSTLIGITLVSTIPFILELVKIPITSNNIIVSTIIMTVLLHIAPLYNCFKHKTPYISLQLEKFQVYELPGLSLTGYFLYISLWRSYNVPTYARDVMSGPEPIADWAIKEHTLINSVFNIDLFSTNNQFKSPFLADLQIIYKMAGFDFGGLWIGIMAIAFTIFVYCILKEFMHPLLASVAVVIMTAAPEMFAYTFMYLFDYPNMTLWIAAVYFVHQLIQQPNRTNLFLSAILFGLGTYIRAETLIITVFMVMLYAIIAYIKKTNIKFIISAAVIIGIFTFIGYFVPTQLYNNYYLPQEYAIGTLINDNLSNIGAYVDRIYEVTDTLLLAENGMNFWLYNIKIFLFLFLIEIIYIIFSKKYKDVNWHYWFGAVLVIYLGVTFMGFLMPLMDIKHSTKRAMFKLIPLLYLFVANFHIIKLLSEKLTNWENTKFNLKLPRENQPQTIAVVNQPSSKNRGTYPTNNSINNKIKPKKRK